MGHPYEEAESRRWSRWGTLKPYGERILSRACPFAGSVSSSATAGGLFSTENSPPFNFKWQLALIAWQPIYIYIYYICYIFEQVNLALCRSIAYQEFVAIEEIAKRIHPLINEHKSLSVLAHEAIRERTLSGYLNPGHWLRQAHGGSFFGVQDFLRGVWVFTS